MKLSSIVVRTNFLQKTEMFEKVLLLDWYFHLLLTRFLLQRLLGGQQTLHNPQKNPLNPRPSELWTISLLLSAKPWSSGWSSSLLCSSWEKQSPFPSCWVHLIHKHKASSQPTLYCSMAQGGNMTRLPVTHEELQQNTNSKSSLEWTHRIRGLRVYKGTFYEVEDMRQL